MLCCQTILSQWKRGFESHYRQHFDISETFFDVDSTDFEVLTSHTRRGRHPRNTLKAAYNNMGVRPLWSGSTAAPALSAWHMAVLHSTATILIELPEDGAMKNDSMPVDRVTVGRAHVMLNVLVHCCSSSHSYSRRKLCVRVSMFQKESLASNASASSQLREGARVEQLVGVSPDISSGSRDTPSRDM